ncbi:MAG TPA: TetR family transcriptional regulator, partial [Solirubrobacterales bacterium]|nr:TetR family transcriptional regulator [Solirubrobacterales bacterium]
MEVLLEEGYAGLTYAKVAVRAGENKSLISYYFGSKQGLVAAVADRIGELITAEVLTKLRDVDSVGNLNGGLV